MKGSHPKISGCFGTGDSGNPVLHLAGCLIGKGKGQYLACAHTPVQKMCYPVSKNTGFSGTCSGNDQGGTFGIDNRFPLGFIQFVKIIMGHELFGITDCRDGKFNEINFSGRESCLFLTFFLSTGYSRQGKKFPAAWYVRRRIFSEAKGMQQSRVEVLKLIFINIAECYTIKVSVSVY